jgi:hypothetical protein
MLQRTVKTIRPVRDDVSEHEGRNPSKIGIAHVVLIDAKPSHDFLDPLAVPDQHGIGEQAQAAGLIHDFIDVSRAELTAIGEEQTARCQIVPIFAAVEL